MLNRTLRIAAVWAFAWIAGTCGEAGATDFFRCLGIGYSAGYNAPAATNCAPTVHKLPGWCGWRQACCQPGAVPKERCGCNRQPCSPCGCGPLPTSPAVH